MSQEETPTAGLNPETPSQADLERVEGEEVSVEETETRPEDATDAEVVPEVPATDQTTSNANEVAPEADPEAQPEATPEEVA